MSKGRNLDEPNMSDTGLLVTVEDLINQAMGPPSAVLHILARQQRILEQRVEIRISESPPRHKLKKHSEVIDDSSESSSSVSPRGRMPGIKEEREPRKRDRGHREKERAEKLAQRAREKEERAASREKAKAQRAASKERERAEKASSKEREKTAKAQLKAEREASKERDKGERSALKELEKAEKAKLKAEKAASKEREKEERAASKEREKAEKEESKAVRAASKEREKEERTTSKERERAERAALKEREQEERATSKEREKAEKAEAKADRAASKEREKEERTASKERERAERAALKEREQEERATSKEREKAEKAEAKADRAAFKEREKEERTASKEREKAEKAALKEREQEERATSKEREKAEKAEAKADRAASKEREKEEKTATKEREKAEKAEKAALKEREHEERATSKEREKAEKAEAKADRAASKEREKEEKTATKEREKAEKAEKAALKEREKEERSASKEREKADKAQSKAERAASKEREKEEKTALKEREKADKELTKAERQAQKDLEKSEKQAQKEQDKAGREQQKADKLLQKEKERAERAAKKEKHKKDEKPSDSGISIKEIKRGKDSVLVVEKGPTTWSDSQGRSSIEVVTQSQFGLLEAAVRELRDMAAPLPLAMPDNEQLRSDLAKGQATLPDTMQAMQIDARVKAAESAIARMTGLLTQLAAAGELPEDLGQQMEEIEMERADMRAEDLRARPSLARKSVIIAPSAKTLEASGQASNVPRPSSAPAPRPSVSIMKQPSSRMSTTTLDQGVNRDEMDDAVNRLREELIKSMNMMTSRAGATADNALHTAKSASDKVDVAATLDVRISTLHSLAVDYADQLHGFDAGLTTQMQSFREQMVQMRGDLKGGLTLLETVNNNAETAAVVELTSRYQELVTELESTLHSHRGLTKLQTQLADELRSLVECVELLREQKADKDEVADGLRDKADTSRLAGLLTETEFALARADLERRLAVCHDKFQKQDNVWMTAVKDLNKILDGKSEILDLLSCRDEVEKQLQLLHDRLKVLAAVLGEPKAAAVKRQLAAGASCAACGTAALMSPRDATRGAPPRLPALRPPPAGASSNEPCLKDWMPPDLPDDRHICRRWCGGSHTLVTASTRREQATAVPTEGAPTKRYTGFGADGRLYMMEEQLQPCVECNQIAQEKCEIPPLDIGAGDQDPQRETVVNIHLTGLNQVPK